ncbi:MAG TPA: hypothetical protein PKW95_22755, partial [bacterium]|nr:hypothetical protein [bacterium]
MNTINRSISCFLVLLIFTLIFLTCFNCNSDSDRDEDEMHGGEYDDDYDDPEPVCDEAWYFFNDCGWYLEDEDGNVINIEDAIAWCEASEAFYSDTGYDCLMDNFGNCAAAKSCIDDVLPGDDDTADDDTVDDDTTDDDTVDDDTTDDDTTDDDTTDDDTTDDD